MYILKFLVSFVATFAMFSASAAEQDLELCAKFNGDIPQLQCYEAVLGHAGKPKELLHVFPPSPPAVPVPPTIAEICRADYVFAAQMMRKRQSGQLMPDALDEAEGNLEVTQMIRNAYSAPLGLVESVQVAQMEQFANQYYGACIDRGSSILFGSSESD